MHKNIALKNWKVYYCLFIYLANEMPFKVSMSYISWIVPVSTKVSVNNISLLQFKLRCCSHSIFSFIFISVSSCFVWPINIKLYVCIVATISSALRMKKVNSINRSCELPIGWIISTPNIIFDSIPNNLKQNHIIYQFNNWQMQIWF